MYCNSCVPFYKGENISVSLKLIKCCLKKMFYFIMLDMFYIFYYVRYVYILGLRIRLNTTVQYMYTVINKISMYIVIFLYSIIQV